MDYDIDIYALIIDIPRYGNNSLDDFSLKLLLENGTELDINKLNELKVNISIPMKNLELLNYDYATYFSEQGYDIYNIKSNFYNDICSPAYYYKNDITLKDRKLEIFPNNVSFNKNNCTYSSADLKNKRLLYECGVTEDYNEEKSDIDNSVQKENFISYFLDLINYKILICTKIPFNIKNYRKNLGIIIFIIYFTLSILFMILFYIYGFSKLRLIFYNEIRNNQKKKLKILQQQKLLLSSTITKEKIGNDKIHEENNSKKDKDYTKEKNTFEKYNDNIYKKNRNESKIKIKEEIKIKNKKSNPIKKYNISNKSIISIKSKNNKGNNIKNYNSSNGV